MLGQRAKEPDLGPAESSGGPEFLRILGQHLSGGRGSAAEPIAQPTVDGPGGLGGQLLADDRSDQRAVVVCGRAASPRVAQAVGTQLVDQSTQNGVGPPEMGDRPRAVQRPRQGRPYSS